MVDVFIVEDNYEIANLVETFLQKEGLLTAVCGSGEEALRFLSTEKAKVVLLDIMLPGIDGFGVLNEIREKNNTPVIIMSALTDKEDKMNGYVLGADDYIEKPVDIDILIAKIRALLKRNYEWEKAGNILHSGSLSIDRDAKCCYKNGIPLSLTVKEYELLLLFMENPGKTLHKDFIFSSIWGMDSFSENQTLTVHIKMLRDKIEEDPKNPKRIITLWGVGYRYEAI